MLGGMDHQRPRYYCGMRGFFRPGMSVSTAVDGISVNKGIEHFFASGIGKNPMGQKRAALMPPMDPPIFVSGKIVFALGKCCSALLYVVLPSQLFVET